jgi:predicted Zn-dependent protease
MKRLTMIASLSALVAPVGSCSTNPATGKPSFTLISEQQEIAMGKEAAADVVKTIGLYPDERAQRYVAELGAKLAARSERPTLPWTFQVVDDPVVNAFALPGGHIFVTRGLLAHMESEAQLATVMGHEIGHVTARHSVQMISKQQVAQLGLAVGMIFSDTLRQFGEVGMAGLSLLFLKYSRDAERQADDLGFRYSVRAGYEVRTMPAMFKTLERVSEVSGGDRLPTWLATHPAPGERIQRIEQEIAQQNPPAGKVDQESLMRTVDGIVFGADPREGFFDGGVFKHPGLRFQVRLPQGWKAQNLKEALVAQSPQGDAALQLTVTGEASPGEALRKFSAQQGLTGVERAEVATGGLPSASARFQAQTQDGQVAGLVTFVAHGGKTFQLLGLAAPQAFAAAAPTFSGTTGSFAPLTDPAALAAKPARLKVIAVDRPTTLAELQGRVSSSVSVERVAIANQLDGPGTPLAPGQKVKLVEGTPPQVAAKEPPVSQSPPPPPAPGR